MDLKEKINKIIELLEKEFPEFSPNPAKSDPLDVLIATMLSQNTTDKTSYRAFMNLKNDYKDWNDVMNAPLSKIRKSIKVCGLAGQKSISIKKLLKNLNEQYGKLSLNHIKKMKDEDIYEELIKHGGVGIKTISCVLAFGLGRDVFPVDTHVHRVTNRLGIATAKTADKTFKQMNTIIPDCKKFHLHTLLIRFGRKICKAVSPLCSGCVLYDLCEFDEKEYYASLSVSKNSTLKDNNFIILEHV